MSTHEEHDQQSDSEGTMGTAGTGPSGLRVVDEVEEHGNLEDSAALVDNTATPKPSLQVDTELTRAVGTSSLAVSGQSAQSIPTVEVTEPHTPRPTDTFTPSPASGMPPPSPSHSHRSSAEGVPSPREPRTPTRRSTIDVGRPSANRLSGFFGHLVGRRSVLPPPPPQPGVRANQEERTTPTTQTRARRLSTSSTTQTPARPTTPPPLLPPPSLNELGLTLSTITSSLSPPHFSTPPTSGAFLAPNFLLLCHAQGLDVLPLVYPPVPQPYALVRRVSFKSVVVMEHRGVLVAIAGRRDGVRVYALEEVKKAVEWRMEVEVRRERERTKREEAKKSLLVPEPRRVSEKTSKPRFQENDDSSSIDRKPSAAASVASLPNPRRPKTPVRQVSNPSIVVEPRGPPPSYSSQFPPQRPALESHASAITVQTRLSRGHSVGDALAALPQETPSSGLERHESDDKGDWVERSVEEEEAIDVLAAGASGSQALDERTSSMTPRPPSSAPRVESTPTIPLSRVSTSQTVRRANRPADLDLTNTMSDPEPEGTESVSQVQPAATLSTIRQTLSQSPPHLRRGPSGSISGDLAAQRHAHPASPEPEDEDDEDESEMPAREQITFAQALFESRLPELPPVGSRRPQSPILFNPNQTTTSLDGERSPRSSETHSARSARSVGTASARRRRRWSVLDGIFPSPGAIASPPEAPQPLPPVTPVAHGPPRSASRPATSPPPTPATAAASAEPRRRALSRSNTARVASSSAGDVRQRAVASNDELSPASAPSPAQPTPTRPPQSATGLFSRILNSAFHPRRSEDRNQQVVQRHVDTMPTVPGHPAPPPKLEYVKLPGTKGALMIKAVETAKKSFLAILCGESGEKVELFAGTYRTALGLSRTFILPDSPRSLELQLQGDDLVEVFLVFSQNVFGLEPATVRVREVRIGRAERRAARRRARNGRADDSTPDAAPMDEETNVNVSIGVAVSTETGTPANEDGESVPLEPGSSSSAHAISAVGSRSGLATPQQETPTGTVTTSTTQPEELIALATAQMGPFTTFQQLSFAPNFPLAAIADEYIIPPTYASFLDYRSAHEPEVEGSSGDLAQVQFTPPGLPVPTPTAPSKWLYRDPKGVVHGPWKASLMQSWYKDGLLPPDLPVRREEDTEYILLRDLRAKSVDPSHPFRPAPPPLDTPPPLVPSNEAKPLLSPISLLRQPRHFGPPSLFFSSRGGHSTAIVDARGRSVLKGRFVWTCDDADEDPYNRLGDVKRLETFDVNDRSVLVAMRQGGLEAVDLGDALLRPGDDSRPVLPHFQLPDAQLNRRSPFIWKIGSPAAYPHGSAAAIAAVPKLRTPRTPAKKSHTGPAKSPNGPNFASGVDADAERFLQDEVFFIGRKDDEVYFCERNAGTFRILRLSPI